MEVILGNSQSGGAGSVLESALESRGISVVRKYKNGSGNDDLLRQLREAKNSIKSSKIDRVHVFGGDADEDGVEQFVSEVGNAPILWWSSSPATRIASMSTAKSVFGSKVTSEDYWFSSGEASRREDRNKKLKSLLSKYKNVTVMDYRDFPVADSVVQKSGVYWPDQPDGIHISNKTAKSLFSNEGAINGLRPKSGIMITVTAAIVSLLALIYFGRRR